MSISATVLINHIVTVIVNVSDIRPPQISILLVLVNLVIQAFLSQILINDFSSFNVFIRGLNCTVFTTPIAVILQVFFLAERASPEHVVRGEEHLIVESLVVFLEICYEI